MLKQHVPDFDSTKFKKMPKLEKAVFLLKQIKNMQEKNEENKESHSFGDNDMVKKYTTDESFANYKKMNYNQKKNFLANLVMHKLNINEKDVSGLVNKMQKHPAAGGQDYTIPGLDIGGIIQQLLPIGVQILQGLLGQATGGGAPAPDPSNGGGAGGAGGGGESGGKGGKGAGGNRAIP